MKSHGGGGDIPDGIYLNLTLKSIYSLNQISSFPKNIPEWNSVSGWKILKIWGWNRSHSLPWRIKQDRDGSQTVHVETQQHPNHHSSTAQVFKEIHISSPHLKHNEPSKYVLKLSHLEWKVNIRRNCKFTIFVSQWTAIWVSVWNWICINENSNQRGGKEAVKPWERSLGERNCTAFLCNTWGNCAAWEFWMLILQLY